MRWPDNANRSNLVTASPSNLDSTFGIPVGTTIVLMRFCREFRSNLCLVLVECLLCGAALAQGIRTSYAPGVNFSKYHTYRWVEVKGQHPDQSVDAQIKLSIDSQLAKKGLTKTSDATSDLDVDYQTAISQTQKWQNYEDWTQTGLPGMNMTQHKWVTIDIGTLVIDMYDTAAKKLIWTGHANKALDPTTNEKTRQENIDGAVKNLLKNFPPK